VFARLHWRLHLLLPSLLFLHIRHFNARKQDEEIGILGRAVPHWILRRNGCQRTNQVRLQFHFAIEYTILKEKVGIYCQLFTWRHWSCSWNALHLLLGQRQQVIISF